MTASLLAPLLAQHTDKSLDSQNFIFTFSFSEATLKSLPFKRVLSHEETQQFLRYINPAAKTQFCITRTYLRIILSHFMNLDPHQITFEKSDKGKLFIPNSLLSFNVSHSHLMGVIAVSTTPMIGIDIEYIKPHYNYQRIVNRYFTPSEQQWLANQPESVQTTSFFNIWTGKEAVAKATGLGFSINFSSFSIIPNDSTISTVISANPYLKMSTSFFLEYLNLSSDYSCCVATHSNKKMITVLSLT